MQKKLRKSLQSLPFGVIALLLAITNILSVATIIKNDKVNPYAQALVDYPYIDPARNFLEQEHFITNIQVLRDYYYALVNANADADIGIYFEVLNTGANISIGQDLKFIPGSLVKMPTALAVMRKIQDEEWSLSNRLVLFEEDKNSGFGDLHKDKVGTSYTIEELLKELIIKSDDTAHRIFVRNLDREELLNVYKGLGLDDLFDQNYSISVKEYSRIFRTLYTSSYLQREYSNYLLQLLAETNFNTLLASGIPDTAVFSHKIGIFEPEKTYLDSGIVYVKNRPYILTVAVKVQTNRKDAEKLMTDISKRAYEFIKDFQEKL